MLFFNADYIHIRFATRIPLYLHRDDIARRESRHRICAPAVEDLRIPAIVYGSALPAIRTEIEPPRGKIHALDRADHVRLTFWKRRTGEKCDVLHAAGSTR